MSRYPSPQCSVLLLEDLALFDYTKSAIWCICMT